LAQRPLPSMMMATWRGTLAVSEVWLLFTEEVEKVRLCAFYWLTARDSMASLSF